MKIAIIGTGIAGMVAAYLLHQQHEITVFEANDYAGGHTNTVDVEAPEGRYAVDTGFIVFNDRNYPNFVRLLDRLGVASRPSSMSFSVQCARTGLEYCGSSLNTLFAQRRNLLRPAFYGMIREILRFNREARGLLGSGGRETTLGDFLKERRYSRFFTEHYIVPMGAAIWSARPGMMLSFPVRHFAEFLDNHGMLEIKNRPQWRVIEGGSRRYVDALTRPFRERIRLNTPVGTVARRDDRVEVTPEGAGPERFDQVVIAAHGDQALALLSDPGDDERRVLGSFAYQRNDTLLHTDESILPRSRRAWASWNYQIPREDRDRVAVTYNMNILQGLQTPRQYCVTLNRGGEVAPSAALRRITYHHPVITARAVAAQKEYGRINGIRRTFYCGAYWGYGFHEDGVNSALAVGRYFGESL